MSDGTVPWSAFAAEAERRLAEAGIEQPELEGRWLVEEAAGFSSGEWFERRFELATVRGVARFDQMIERRLAGVPIQYVLGHWPFRMLDLMIDTRVLIPRPETEVLAGLVLDRLASIRSPLVVDLGTGSGAIGLAVAFEHPTAQIWLTDSDPDAISVARANLAGLGRHGSRVGIVEGDWFEALPEDLRGTVDVLVSNPPYVADGAQLDASVIDHEPHTALFSGPQGTNDLAMIVNGAPGWLAESGALFLEMGPQQVALVCSWCRDAGFGSVVTARDLAGIERFVIATRGQPL